MRTYFNKALIITLFTLAGIVGSVQAQDQPQRSIEKLTGDLYWAHNNAHNTVILVTDEGIIISDPIEPGFAAWLKQELKSRFNKPVKYVLYSHYHQDHAAGGDVFKDTATFVGHENMLKNLAAVSSDSAYANVRKPDVVYQDKLAVSLGGKTVEMRYTGKNHTDDMSVLYFPAEKTVFIVDFLSVKRMPWRTMSGHFPDWYDSIKVVEAMDFDILMPGHGVAGTKQDATDHRGYMEDLRDAVAKGIKQGKSVKELQKSITMDAYKNWQQFERMRAENIAGMYDVVNKAKK